VQAGAGITSSLISQTTMLYDAVQSAVQCHAAKLRNTEQYSYLSTV